MPGIERSIEGVPGRSEREPVSAPAACAEMVPRVGPAPGRGVLVRAGDPVDGTAHRNGRRQHVAWGAELGGFRSVGFRSRCS